MEILRKITIKTAGNFTRARLNEVIAAAKLADAEQAPILRVAGESSGAKTGQTDKGTFTKLSGSFIATDLTTGAQYQSGQCILPEFIGAQLGAGLIGGDSVRFAFEIAVQRKDDAITGYQFAIKPLMETKLSAPMLELATLIGIDPAAPKLAAPSAAATPADAAAPAKAPAKGRK